MITEPDLCAYLARLGVNYQRCDHAPVYTCSEAAQALPALSGAPTKNLFLRDRRGRQHLLLVLRQGDAFVFPGLFNGQKLAPLPPLLRIIGLP